MGNNMNKFVAIDDDCNIGYGDTPEEAITQYKEGFDFVDVSELTIYQATNLKAKSVIVITGSSVGT